MIYRRFPLFDATPGATGGGEAAAPAAAPAPSPAPAPAPQSILMPPAAAPAPAPAADGATPAADDVPAWLPEKYRVLGTDGKLDMQASSQKLAEGYGAAVKRIGTGDLPPEKPEGYAAFTPPEQFKDVQLDEGLSNAFRGRAHAAGLTQKQYEFVMGEYFGLVPSMLDAATKVSADDARQALQQVWQRPGEYDAGVAAANRAVAAAPEAIRGKLFEKFGHDPDFIQFAASFGKEMREDKSPGGPTPAAGADVAALMASPAYTDSKHPQHAAVSKQVQDHFARAHGTAALA